MSNELQDLSIATLALVILGMSGLVVYQLVSLVRLQRKHDALVRGHNAASDIEDAEREPQQGRPRLRVVESWFGVAAIIGVARWIKDNAGHSITVALVGAVAVPTIALLPHIVDPPDRDDDRVVTATAAAPPTRRAGALGGPITPRVVPETPPAETTSSTPPAETTTAAPTATATPTTAAPTTVTPTTARPTSTPSSATSVPHSTTAASTTTAAPITTAPGSGQPRAGGPDPGGSPATPTPPTAPTTAPLVVGGSTPAPIVPRETCLHVIVLDACVGVR